MYLLGLTLLILTSVVLFRKTEDINDQKAQQSIGIIFEIIFYPSLQHFIIKQKLYKHHFVSCGISIIILIIIFIISAFYINKIYICYEFFFLNGLLGDISDVFVKKYMNDCYKTPYYVVN